MKRWRIAYTTEDWWNAVIEADSEEEAMTIFMSGEYDHANSKLVESGFLQDSVEVYPMDDPVMHLMGSNGNTYCGWPMPGLLRHELTGFYSATTCQACKDASGMTKPV